MNSNRKRHRSDELLTQSMKKCKSDNGKENTDLINGTNKSTRRLLLQKGDKS